MIRPDLMPATIELYLETTRSWAADVPRAFAEALGLEPATPIVPSPLFRLRHYSRLGAALEDSLESAEAKAIGFWFQHEVPAIALEFEPKGDSNEWQILRAGAGTHVRSWIDAYEKLGAALAADPREWTVWFAHFATPGIRVVMAASENEILASPAGPAHLGVPSGLVRLEELAARFQEISEGPTG